MAGILVGAGIGVAVAAAEIAMVRSYEKNKHRLAAVAFHWLAISTMMPFVDFGVATGMTGLFVTSLTLAGLELLEELADRQLVQLSIFRVLRQPLLDVLF